ncbi:MAG: VOC family protein [Dehalococcoidia bacterium]
MQVNGLGYPAIIVRNVEASAEFYTRTFGMERLYTEPNRDDDESVQTMLHAGGDSYLLLIGPTDPNLKLADASLGVGSMQYLTLQVSGETMDRAFFELSEVGTHASEEIRRGYERLVFLEDPNGVLILLTAWTTEPPDGVERAAVLKRASELREAQDSPFVEDLHIKQAIAELSG